MAAPETSFSDEERDRLRAALRDYADHYQLSPQQLADRISDATNYALEFDAGRRRVDRFLKNSHRQPDDFIAAIAAFLGTVPPPDIEDMAASLAHFFARRQPHRFTPDELVGRYLAWASTDRRPEHLDGLRTVTVLQGDAFSEPPPSPISERFAYAVIELRHHAKSGTLMASEAVVNPDFDPDIVSFPDTLPPVKDAGIFVPFGFSDREIPRYLMTTRSILETRLYRLFRVATEPLTLRGDLHFTGNILRSKTMTHGDPFYPDYEIELVKIEEDQGRPVALAADIHNKRVLFVFTAGHLRTPPAEDVFDAAPEAARDPDSPRLLTKDMVASADIIFALEDNYRDHICQTFDQRPADAYISTLHLSGAHQRGDMPLIEWLKKEVEPQLRQHIPPD